MLKCREIKELIREVCKAGIAQLDIETVEEKITIRRVLGGPEGPDIIRKEKVDHDDLAREEA